MDIRKVYTVYFSPTGTTERAVKAVAEGTGLPAENIDLTTRKARGNFSRSFTGNDLIIAGMPVYSGRIPKNVDDFFPGFKGNGAPAVAVVVYGNREYEDALIEMKNRLEERGFKVVAGAVFVGEHTFSKNIAGGRPDGDDLKIAREFGRRVIKEIDEAGKLTVKGNYPYVARGSDPAANMGPAATVALVTASEDCTRCGLCEEECPWGAISVNETVTIDYTKCLRCLRCIKVCPAGAMAIKDPKFYEFIAKFEEMLKGRHREPEFFVGE